MTETTGMFIKGISNFLCYSLWCFGLWKPFNGSKLQMASYCSYSVVFLFIFSVLYTFFMVCNIFFLTDFSDLTNRLFMSLTEAALVIKVINFFIYNDEWQHIYNDIRDFGIKTSEERQIVESSGRQLRLIDYIYFFLADFNVFITAMLSILNGTLLYSSWYPGLDWQNNQRDYWFLYGYQIVGILVTCNLNLVVDTYYCLMMSMTSAHFQIFGQRLSALQLINDKRSVRPVRIKLIEQIRSHQRINANFELIGKNLLWGYFCQVLLSGIVISSITIKVARVSSVKSEIIC